MDKKEKFKDCNAMEVNEDVDKNASLRMKQWFVSCGHKNTGHGAVGIQLDMKGNFDNCDIREVDKYADNDGGPRMGAWQQAGVTMDLMPKL